MQQFGPDRISGNVVSGGRSEILADRAVNASHRNNAEQILAGRRYGASVRNPLLGRKPHGRFV
jgi:hypothetical protein